MATKTTKKTTKTTTKDDTPPQSVPLATRGKGAKALLSRFGGGKKKAPAKKSTKDRPELDLTPEATEALREFAPVAVLLKLFEAECKGRKAEMNKLLWCLYTQVMYDKQAQPQNPKLVAKRLDDNGNPTTKNDVESQFVVMEKYKVNVPDFDDDESTPEEAVADALVRLGISRAKADKVATEELDFMPQVRINVTSLLHGEKVGKDFKAASTLKVDACTKLLDYLDGESAKLSLSDAEKEAITEARHCDYSAVAVTTGFLDRAPGYCDDVDQLRGLFKIVVPQIQIRQTDVGTGDDDATRDTRIATDAVEILGELLENLPELEVVPVE